MAEESGPDRHQGKLFRIESTGKVVAATEHTPSHTVYADGKAEAHQSPTATTKKPSTNGRNRTSVR